MKLSFNISRMIQIWMPEILCRPRHLAWLQVVLCPMSSLWAAVLIFYRLKLYQATITGETNRLTKALQDSYDPGIYIIQPSDYLDTAWIFLKNEPQLKTHDFVKAERKTPPEYDYRKSEYNPDFDFIIRLPRAAADKSAEIKRFLKNYILAGKKYLIELY